MSPVLQQHYWQHDKHNRSLNPLLTCTEKRDHLTGQARAFHCNAVDKNSALKQLSQMLNHICGSTLRLNKGLKRFLASEKKEKRLRVNRKR